MSSECMGVGEAIRPNIVVGYIKPILAEDLLLDNLVTARIPIPAPPEVFTPDVLSMNPVRAGDRTIAHARLVARRLVDAMRDLPVTEEAGDALALALTVLHFTEEE